MTDVPSPPVGPAAETLPESPEGDRFAADLRGFGPVGLLAILLILLTGNIEIAPMVFVPVGALLVLLWAWRSRTPWGAIGYRRPRSWVGTLVVGLALGAALKILMKAVVMPLLGADPINRSYHFLTGNTALLPLATYAMLNAGFSEETLFRGYAFERLRRLLGHGAVARTTIVLSTSLLFGLAHYASQGITGTEQATITGLVWGTIFSLTGRLPMLMVAHAAFDLTALAMIYGGYETRMAHLIFK